MNDYKSMMVQTPYLPKTDHSYKNAVLYYTVLDCTVTAKNYHVKTRNQNVAEMC